VTSADPHNTLEALLKRLRVAHRSGDDVNAVLRASTERMTSDPVYREGLRRDIRALMRSTTSTHVLSEAGIVSDETIGAGVLRRLGAKLAPAPPRSASLGEALEQRLSRRDSGLLRAISAADATAWTTALLDSTDDWDDHSELASALVILATRVAGAGLDARLSERIPALEEWRSPFIALSRAIDHLAEVYVSGAETEAAYTATLQVLDRCIQRVEAFRIAKETLGTTLHLSSASLRMLQQLERLRLLTQCTAAPDRPRAVAELGLQLLRAVCRPRRTLHFVQQKLELIAYLVVGHAARKGAKYAVRRASEYLGFWYKSLLGGCLVAVFAALKIHLSHDELAPVPQAFIFGLNYAVCFVLIYLLGGTLATKQPALTASRLAESLESPSSREPFARLVRTIWRSQFVSFLGNLAGASVFAALIAYGFAQLTGADLVSREEALSLYDKLHPLESGTLFYAAIAGVMLSVAGFFAGFVDNAVVFHRVGDRVRAGGGIFRWVGGRRREPLAKRIEKSSGAVSGNLLLGFMLGSAGSVGLIFGVPFDIRHIAFASSHSTLALMYAPELLTLTDIALVVAAVSLIGLINFLVSFSLTLSVAINARRLEGVDWRAQLRAVWQLAKSHPIAFFLPIGGEEADPGETGVSPGP
jgi:site-specific recombinase